MRLLKILAIFSASLVLGAQSPAAITIKDSPGGLLDVFAMHRYELEKEGVEVHLAGRCASACTIYTGMQKVCVEDGAYFQFHQGYAITPHDLGQVTYLMLHMMHPAFKTYIENYGYPLPVHHTVLTAGRDDRADSWHQEWLVLDGAEAVANGWMKAC